MITCQEEWYRWVGTMLENKRKQWDLSRIPKVRYNAGESAVIYYLPEREEYKFEIQKNPPLFMLLCLLVLAIILTPQNFGAFGATIFYTLLTYFPRNCFLSSRYSPPITYFMNSPLWLWLYSCMLSPFNSSWGMANVR